MAFWEDIETRTLSGTGSIRIPQGEDNQYRAYRLYLQIIRPPKNRYRNFKFPQSREYFGKALYYKDLYVCNERELNWTAELWEFVGDYSSQNLIAIKCLYDAIVSLSSTLSSALSVSLEPVENVINDYTYLQLPVDRIVFKLYDSTALTVSLQGLKHDTCNPINDKQQPPDNPPPPDRNPPTNDAPIVVSPPYDGDDDYDFFQPFPEDEVDDGFPFGDACTEYDIDLLITPFAGDPIPLTVRLFGIIDGAGIGGDGSFVFVIAQGGRDSIDPISPTCLEEPQPCAVFGSTEPSYSSVEILDIREV